MESLESGVIGHIFKLLTEIDKNYVNFFKNRSSIWKNISSKLVK
jgi:hypothetical protein